MKNIWRPRHTELLGLGPCLGLITHKVFHTELLCKAFPSELTRPESNYPGLLRVGLGAIGDSSRLNRDALVRGDLDQSVTLAAEYRTSACDDERVRSPMSTLGVIDVDFEVSLMGS